MSITTKFLNFMKKTTGSSLFFSKKELEEIKKYHDSIETKKQEIIKTLEGQSEKLIDLYKEQFYSYGKTKNAEKLEKQFSLLERTCADLQKRLSNKAPEQQDKTPKKTIKEDTLKTEVQDDVFAVKDEDDFLITEDSFYNNDIDNREEGYPMVFGYHEEEEPIYHYTEKSTKPLNNSYYGETYSFADEYQDKDELKFTPGRIKFYGSDISLDEAFDIFPINEDTNIIGESE